MVYSLHVLECVANEKEELFLGNVRDSLTEKGVMIVGMQLLQSQLYTSPQQDRPHQLQRRPRFQGIDAALFDHIFTFSMNDVVVHAGYFPMAHYLFALCSGRKK